MKVFGLVALICGMLGILLGLGIWLAAPSERGRGSNPWPLVIASLGYIVAGRALEVMASRQRRRRVRTHESRLGGFAGGFQFAKRGLLH